MWGNTSTNTCTEEATGRCGSDSLAAHLPCPPGHHQRLRLVVWKLEKRKNDTFMGRNNKTVNLSDFYSYRLIGKLIHTSYLWLSL
jgi:hypothetical protein